MGGRHAARHTHPEVDALAPCHDLCACGRPDPRTTSPDALAREAKAYRRVQRAAARLRLVTDRRLERGPSPEWVVDLAKEQGDPILGPSWVEQTIARLDKDARAHCPCRCHGRKTQEELNDEARDERNFNRAEARLQKTIDAELGRSTTAWILRMAEEGDE
jgi:hypothetical protein